MTLYKGTGLRTEPQQWWIEVKGLALDSGSGVMWRLDDELALQMDG